MHENNKVIKLFMFKLYKIITATAKKLIFEERNRLAGIAVVFFFAKFYAFYAGGRKETYFSFNCSHSWKY
jgi:hypothetical protein